MAKRKASRKNRNVTNAKVQEIESKRTGGQIALRGFSYQLMYSCYKVLEFIDSENKSVRFEGIEDIDLYKSLAESNDFIEHIQLKHSKGREDASFFDDILKNYLEVYLVSDKSENRYFKLVYDLEIAQGNLSKLINNNLDDKSKAFWINKIEKIKERNQQWQWEEFGFDEFYSKLRFQYLPQQNIMTEIQNLIISRFEINTGSEQLFLNSLFYNVFHMTKERAEISYSPLLQIIQNTKDDVSKGYKNPVYGWIDRINFNIDKTNKESQYFDGKKPTIDDIVNNLPVRRNTIERKIKTSINESTITVIKSSSGQGKTTLALQVANDLKEEYCIYKLNWCKDTKEINNIVQYFNSRLKLGEKILIVIDNLDSDTQEWNKLAQMLAEKIKINYKILLTTREEDWYHFAGDQSKLGNINIISLFLEYNEAETIFENLKTCGKVHSSIKNWQSIWERVKDRRVLIEYIYLLTHGEMLGERIVHQLKKFATLNNANVKKDILCTVSLADVIGVKIKISDLIKSIKERYASVDLNEIMKSIENEYLIKFNEDINFVEGLHPVRSKYILDSLHDYYPINETFMKLLSIIDESYVDKVYSQIPSYIDEDKDEFYEELSNRDVKKSYRYISNAIKGLFSGTILKYYNNNKSVIDDADKHGGLMLFLNEINPWNNKCFGSEVKTLEYLNTIQPENKNIQYLLQLTNTVEKHNIKQADYYIYSYYLFQKLESDKLKRNKEGFDQVVNWLRRIDNKFNILSNIKVMEIWENRDEWVFEELVNLMYIFYLLEKEKYIKFIEENKNDIFSYLKIKTNSLSLVEDEERIYINYLLPLSDFKIANSQSVNRINVVCKLLPIYKLYCTDSIRPKIEWMENLQLIDDSHKEMPFENVILSFNSDLNGLWSKSIISQFEFDSIYDWQNYWITLRNEIVEFLNLNIIILEKLLKKQKLSKDIIERIDTKRQFINNAYIREKPFPFQERPFEEKTEILSIASKIKSGYITSVFNYCAQFANIIDRSAPDDKRRVALYNIVRASKELAEMQSCFQVVIDNTYNYFDTGALIINEKESIEKLIKVIEYYIEHVKANNGVYSNHSFNIWNKQRHKIYMNSIFDAIDYAQNISQINIIKPIEVMHDGMLTIVPIIIEEKVAKSDEDMGLLLISFLKFVDVKIDFILLLLKDEDNNILSNGVRINKNYISIINDNIDDIENLNMDGVIHPLPYEINDEILKCFNGDYIIKYNFDTRKLEKVEAVLLGLWEYNKYREYLVDENEVVKEYLIGKLNYCRVSIENTLSSINKSNYFNEYDKLTKLKNKVIDNKMVFSDKELNFWINELNN